MLLLLLACRGSLDPTLASLDGWSPEGLSAPAWNAGLKAWACAARSGRVQRPSLAIADLGQPSDAERLWVVDLAAREVRRVRVAHGSNTGGRWATAFSNEPGSHQTSLGLYRGAEIYDGKHGRSLRLDGLQASNDAARDRAIVVHSASYVDDAYVAEHGRAGRSWGCPALDPDVSDSVIDALTDGGALWMWHRDHDTDLAWTCDTP